MDFGTLLSVAEKNEIKKQPVAYYQTKFSPPKKQTKQTKNLSENIKKFLARKEEEEKKKLLEEKKKRENLLALRDHKAQSRINKHLKVCKAANKSVLADAIDNNNTAITIAGPSQPDEDDYGYVSQEASNFYNQLMKKYNNIPSEKPLFSENGKKPITDIASTKDRVKQALKQQEIDDCMPHKRKRKLQSNKDESGEKNSECNEVHEDVEKNDERPKKRGRPPPPMDFKELLKLAEKKQHEPVVIEAKPKPKEEPERLMTKKQMKEYMKEKDWRDRREQKNQPAQIPKKQSNTNNSPKSNNQNTLAKPQSSKNSQSNEKLLPSGASRSTSKPVTPPNKNLNEKSNTAEKNRSCRGTEKNDILEERKKLEAEKKKLEMMRRALEEERRKLEQDKNKKVDDSKPTTNNGSKPINKVRDEKASSMKEKSKQLSSSNIKSRPFPPPDVKTRQSSIPNGKPKQFPPPDIRPMKSKPLDGRGTRKPAAHKRRIYDEDEEEYDSELDDFIDDGPEEESADYSKYISEIFGYDKSKYRHLDDADDRTMESNFAQQLKEEFVSTKIGIMEDLEDIRQEAMEKKRKALMKKKIKK